MDPVYPWGEANRSEIEPFIPLQANKVLDVGCGTGAFGDYLKSRRPQIEVWGIEPTESGFMAACSRLDHVIRGHFPCDMQDLPGPFDCIVFNDVLEHMLDPSSALATAKALTEESGMIVASIPNIRYVGILIDLVFRGRWDYVDKGILDRTHLRFFTKSTMIELFQESGWDVEVVRPISTAKFSGMLSILNPILRMLHELFTTQYVIVAGRELA